MVVVGFYGLFGHVLEVFLPHVLPVSVAGIFKGQELELRLCSGVVCEIVEYQNTDGVLSPVL